MLRRLPFAARYTLGQENATRTFTVFPDDVFLVSYPRSGNTWARFLVGNLLSTDEPVTFSNIEAIVPDVHINSDRELQRSFRPRLLKSHAFFDPRYSTVIMLVRDPRDVVVSYHYYRLKMRMATDEEKLDHFVPRFIAGEADANGSWGHNVGSWLGARADTKGFVLIRYEDLVENPAQELRKITDLLGIEPERVETAIELSSFERMRGLEAAEAHLWKPTRESRRDVAFVRSGKTGGWRDVLPQACADRIVEAWRPLMTRLGYV